MTEPNHREPSNLPHTVSEAPFDPYSVEAVTPEQERYYLATQWQLMWWKLKRHKLAVWSGIFLIVLYASIFISELIAPYALQTRNTDFLYHPPQSINLFHEGEFVGPFVYKSVGEFDLKDFQWRYTEDTTTPQPIRFFCLGDSYEYFGLIEGRFHLFCPATGGELFLFGTPLGSRRALSGDLWRANFANRWAVWRRNLVHYRHRCRRACRLLRRLGG